MTKPDYTIGNITFNTNPAPHAAAPQVPTGHFMEMTATYPFPLYKRDIVIVTADDWEATYIDGRLFNEDHSVMLKPTKDLLEYLGFTVTEIYSAEFQEHFENYGCPKSLEELYKATQVEELFHICRQYSVGG